MNTNLGILEFISDGKLNDRYPTGADAIETLRRATAMAFGNPSE